MSRLFNLEDAKKVAGILLKEGRICGVELFGSVARYGQGQDLDLILLVQNRTLTTEFILQTNRAIKEALEVREILGMLEDSVPGPHLAYDFTLREHVAIAVFKEGFQSLLNEAHESVSSEPVITRQDFDVFVLSLSWRDEIRYLEQGFPQGDPDFWSNLKREAITLSRR